MSNCKEGSHPSSSRLKGRADREAARLDLGALEDAVRWYFTMGLALSTQRRSGKDHYISFCDRVGVHPLPATEKGLCLFVTFLTNHESLKYISIKVYLSAVRHLHTASAVKDTFAKIPPMNRLEYVMKGIKG